MDDLKQKQIKIYRKEEMHADVYALLERVWRERGPVVITKMIDNAIEIQNDRSVFTACNYIRYLLLHELSWIDVFGYQAREYDEQLKHYKQCQELEKKVDQLQYTVNQMQIVMMNMAKMLNDKQRENMLKRA